MGSMLGWPGFPSQLYHFPAVWPGDSVNLSVFESPTVVQVSVPCASAVRAKCMPYKVPREVLGAI